jgi:methyl-accepting chemotaxis protein
MDVRVCKRPILGGYDERVFLILSLLLPITMLTTNAASAETKLAATIFSYDGADFVRTQTSLTQDGQSAVNTKLDPDSPAYKALSQKQSYSGPATIMGQGYDAHYAPLVGTDGKLTGALFVGVPK